MRKILLLLLSLTLATSAVQAKTGWKKFGAILYPSSLILVPRDPGYEGFAFHDYREFWSADKKVHLVFGYNANGPFPGKDVVNLDTVPESQRVHFVAERDYKGWIESGKTYDLDGNAGSYTVDYSVLKKNWFVISGTDDKGTEFYVKALVFPPFEEIKVPVYTLELDYPASQRTIYDPICAKIMQSFTFASIATIPQD